MKDKVALVTGGTSVYSYYQMILVLLPEKIFGLMEEDFENDINVLLYSYKRIKKYGNILKEALTIYRNK